MKINFMQRDGFKENAVLNVRIFTSLHAWLWCVVTGVSSAFAASSDIKTVDFVAASPLSYDHAIGGGAYNDRTLGEAGDVITSLNGARFSCGDVVTYLASLEMASLTVEERQSTQFQFRFSANTTEQSGAAFEKVLGVRMNYEPDSASAIGVSVDTGISDDGQSVATLQSQTLTGPLFSTGSELLATVTVSDLEAGEKVVLRVDMLLACQAGSSPSGQLDARLDAVIALPSQEVVNVSPLTVPFLNVGDVTGAGEAVLKLTKTVTTVNGECGVDDVKQLSVLPESSVKYCYSVENSGTLAVYDVLLIDDNGTPNERADDFTVPLSGLQDVDFNEDALDLLGGTSAFGEWSAILPVAEGIVASRAEVIGNNNGMDVNFLEFKDADTLSVTVASSVNNPPNAEWDTAVTDQGTPVFIEVTGNDTDSDHNLDIGSVAIVSQPSHGTVSVIGEGVVLYEPGESFSGTDQFDYQVCDALNACATATVTITVTAASHPPVANDDILVTEQDTPKDIDVIANDTDPDGDLDPESISVEFSPENGSIINHGDGTLTYAPFSEFFGVDSFEYEICDLEGFCALAEVSVTVLEASMGANAPMAMDDSVITDEDSAVFIPVAINDSDEDGNIDPFSLNLTCTQCVLPSSGSALNVGNGVFIYTPKANFHGEDLFVYEICDTGGLCDTATVVITVVSVNDKPVAQDDQVIVLEDVLSVLEIVGNDFDPDDDLDIFSLNTDCAACGVPQFGTLVNFGDSTLIYTPDPNFNGDDRLVYEICDKEGACDTAVVSIRVLPINDAPVPKDDLFHVDEDETLVGNVLSDNGFGEDGDIDLNLDPSTVTIIQAPQQGQINLTLNGGFRYQPNSDYFGSDVFRYNVCDTDGVCGSATVDIVVNPINDAPTAVDDSAVTLGGSAVVIPVVDNDTDRDGDLDLLRVVLTRSPSFGTASTTGDGRFTYTPESTFTGTDDFEYQVCDSEGLCDRAVVVIVVSARDVPPVPQDDAQVVVEDTETTLFVSRNDSDEDGNLDPATVRVVAAPSQGRVVNNHDGSLVYRPNSNYYGQDLLTYEICDTTQLCATAVVSLEVVAVNDEPVARSDSYTSSQDTVLTIDASGVLSNDTDVDGDVLSVMDYDRVSEFGGQLTVFADGSLTYEPAKGFAGVDIARYTVSDGYGGQAQATISVVVEARNNRSISVDLQQFSFDHEGTLSGVLSIRNQSGGYDVQINDLAIELQYQIAGQGWQSVGVLEDSCVFNPETPFLIKDAQRVSFDACQFVETIPSEATVRVTARVHIFGRFNGKGKSEGWFLDRLSY